MTATSYVAFMLAARFRLPLGVTVLIASLVAFTGGVQAQVSCGLAFSMLRNFAGNVNAIANAEYRWNIPARCHGYLPCMNAWLPKLNAWHARQMSLVRQWHVELVRQCAASPAPQPQPPEPPRAPAPRPTPQPELERTPPKQDRLVRIDIPTTPEGFR